MSEKFDVFSNKFAHDIYLQKYSMDKQETWTDTCKRVVESVCGQYLDSENKDKIYNLMVERKFIPGGRYLYSSGRPFHQVNNCFLFRAEDSREGWADAVNKATMALMTGGGIGFDYSKVRARGSKIHKTGGEATGPVSLMQMINEAGRHIMQGGQRRCLPEGSMVHTQRGLVKIEDVIPNEDKALTSKGYYNITNKFEQGLQKTITIKTQNGEFECTPNHKMAVLTSVKGEYTWKEAGRLEEGDRLLFTATAIEGRKTNLPPSNYIRPKNATTVNEITIPELDTEMAWFIGYFHANGHSRITHTGKGKRNSSVGISIPHAAEHLIEPISNCLAKFGVNVKVKQGDGACFNVKTTSIPLALWIQENIKVSNESMDIPQFILEGTKDIRAAYVAGVLDGDGSISSRPIQVMSCIHKDYLKQLQNVCASLGFTTRLHLNRKAIGNWKALYRLLLKGSKQEKVYYETVGNFLKYKIEQPRTRVREFHSYSFPPGMVRNSDINKSSLHKNYNVNYPIEKIEKAIGEKLDFTPIKVEAIIVNDEEVETYDIEVESVHEFYCNGILTHNSAIWAGLKWDHNDIEEFMYSKDWSDELRKIKEDDFNFPLKMEGTNISVIYDTEFFVAMEDKKHPKHKLAKEVWLKNCQQAFRTAEPGMSMNFLKDNESLRNACTEVVSEDDSDKCNLGTVWMNRFDNKEEFGEAVSLATQFLLCGNLYSDVPFEKIKEVGQKNNRIGLGLGGMHEWLMVRGYDYEVTPELHKWLNIYEQESDSAAYIYSKELGLPIPKGKRAIAPTGTIGILAETTTGIEPLFCKAYKRRYLQDEVWKYQYVVDGAVKRLMDQGVPVEKIKDAYDLDFKQRVKFQADVQNYVDMAISSTCNLPSWGSEGNNEENLKKNAKVLLKYAKRLRGFTCYPDGARGGQPLTRVDLEEALKQEGQVFEEKEHECVGGVCGI